jgi:cytochrome c553
LNSFVISFLGIALILAFGSGDAFASVHVSAGRALALSACTACHIVEPNQQRPPIIAIRLPTFQQIADDPQTSEVSLRRFLHDPHIGNTVPFVMPEPNLSEDQIHDLAAYIMSLRRIHRVRNGEPATIGGY